MRLSARVSVAIQHHLARPELPERLMMLLGERVEVVEDPEPFSPASPWRSYREACRLTPEWATHRLILQDDAMPCDGFLDAARMIARFVPDRVVAFYVGQHAAGEALKLRAAAATCQAYAVLDPCPWIPVVATMWPAEWATGLATFHLPAYERDHVADDEVAGDYLRHLNQRTYLATVPCLVQHDDDVISTMAGHRHDGRYRLGACWIEDHHPSIIDWSRVPER